jgi:uncharacterized lipoprotein YmbA
MIRIALFSCRHPMRLPFYAALVSVLSGCTLSPTPTDYFLLEPVAPLAREYAASAPPVVIGLGPIRFPRYVDRPQMVVALSGGQFRLRENERWADNLRENFSRVLAEDLAARIPGDRVLLHPWSRTDDVDFKLTVRVNEFHMTDSGAALLDARWELFDPRGLVASRQSRVRAQADDNTPAMGVVALSRTVGLFAKECAELIRQTVPRQLAPEGRAASPSQSRDGNISID